jgi:hypothetical protein
MGLARDRGEADVVHHGFLEWLGDLFADIFR